MKKTTLTLTDRLPVSRGVMAALCCVSFLGATGLQAQTWNGGGGDSNWSTSGNWSGGVAPASGNTTALIFSGTSRLAPNMDTDFTVKSLTISGSGAFDFMGAHTLTFDGNLVTGNPTVFTNNDASAQTIESNIVVHNSAGTGTSYLINNGGSLTLNGSATMTTAADFRTVAGATTIFNGAMSSIGVTFDSSSATTAGGTIVLAGTTANTSTGNVVMGVSTGLTLELAKSSGVTALAGNAFFLQSGATLKLDNDDQIAHAMQMRWSGGTILMQGHSAIAGTIILSGNTVLDFGSGSQVGFTLTGVASTWSAGTLTIDNWNGTDYLRTAANPSTTFLSNITFNGYGAGAKATQMTNADGTFYYVTPLAVPEPGKTALLGVGGALALLAGMKARHKEEAVH